MTVGVRNRLGLTTLRHKRCFNFITTLRDSHDFIYRDLPAVVRKTFDFITLEQNSTK